MSRIGKLPIPVSSAVKVGVGSNNVVSVKGPKGELTLQVDPDISIDVADGEINIKRPTDQKRHRSLHGLYRSLIANMVTGVTDGYKRQLHVLGVGYRAEVQNVGGQPVLELGLGYSHPIYFMPPEGIAISVDSGRGKTTTITVEGIDKQLVGQVSAKIRALRPPEPYKGKGVRYADEHVRRKAGKTAAR